MKISDFLGKSMDGFTVQELVEIFKTNEDGQKTITLGYCHSENVANAFVGTQIDANWYKTAKVVVLTNGKEGFLIGEVIALLDDEIIAAEAKKKALAKLSPEERKLLGL